MACSRTWMLSLCGLACLALAAPGRAAAFNESVDGDLSNDGLAPTVVTLASGSNTVTGTTGRASDNSVDRDYFSITVPTGQVLSAIRLLPGTTVGGSFGFLGLEAGAKFTLPTNTTTAAGLLGWSHYGPADVGTDLLPAMAVPASGSSGFTAPLGAGTYSLWEQDTSGGIYSYGLDFVVTAAPVPEPSLAALMLAGLASLTLLGRWRGRS